MWSSVRHRTAISRTSLSRPLQLALADELILPASSVFDYGCGRGGDIARLTAQGIACQGWDPVHRPDEERRVADVVNLGYVINVIEDIHERAAVLRTAWSLARSVLIVSARLQAEVRMPQTDVYHDGYVTRLGTFQKLYHQHELREWIDSTLEVSAVPAGPGIFYVFRDEAQRHSYLASRFRRRNPPARVARPDVLYEQHRALLDPLLDFLSQRGRLPEPSELPQSAAICAELGSLARAFRILREVSENTVWETTQEQRTQDLLIYLALERFSHRPRFSELPTDLQADIRAFFTSYQAACELADAMLFSIGNIGLIDQLCRKSQVGKQTPAALYVHESALPELDPILRLYEGCARAFIGSVEGANLIKLHRRAPQISYLAYPDFDRDPHPALRHSMLVTLQNPKVEIRHYDTSENPPILHRKEEFVAAGYPSRETFARLTAQEERFGLYTKPSQIGTRNGWTHCLKEKGLTLRGHRIVRN